MADRAFPVVFATHVDATARFYERLAFPGTSICHGKTGRRSSTLVAGRPVRHGVGDGVRFELVV